MADAIGGTIPLQANDNVSSGSSSGWDRNPTAGSTVIVMVACNNSADPTFTVTDNQSGNTYVEDQGTLNQSGGAMKAGVVRASNVNSSGTFTLTVTCSGGAGSFITWGALWATGLVAAPLDQHTGAGQSASTSFPPGSVTVAQNDELLIACTVNNGAGSNTLTDPSGYTAVFNDGSNSGADIGGGGSYKLIEGGGSFNPTYTTSTSVDGAAVQATYKAAAVIYVPYDLPHSPGLQGLVAQ